MNLQAPPSRVLIEIDLESKNSHAFEDGTTIRLERQYNNFNRRETQPVNATVLAADNIPAGAEVLIHHNALHDTFKVNNFKNLSGTNTATSVKHYSITENECFAWRINGGEWQPTKDFAFGLRLFKPYGGLIEGIEPTIIKQALYITTGEFQGKVVKTLKACDYEIIYQGDDGREKRLLRLRHYENEANDREEILFVDTELTNMVYEQKILVGLSKSDCKPLEIHAYAD